jgi:integrase
MAGMSRPGGETSRDRVLTDDELVKVWQGADAVPVFGSVARLLILTGLRLNEAGRLRWSEIEGNAINLGGDRTKNGRPLLVPLSDPARMLIAEIPRIDGCEFCFSADGRRPVSGWSRIKCRLDAASGVTGWRLHDIRRTVATGMAEIGVQPHIVEACLNHVSGAKAGVAGTYNRAAYAVEKGSALAAWGAHVTALVEGREPGKVVPIRGTPRL